VREEVGGRDLFRGVALELGDIVGEVTEVQRKEGVFAVFIIPLPDQPENSALGALADFGRKILPLLPPAWQDAGKSLPAAGRFAVAPPGARPENIEGSAQEVEARMNWPRCCASS
jgi:hypothetical protein